MNFLYTLKTKVIEVESLANSKIPLYFFSDVHWDTPSCDHDRFNWFLSEAKKDPDAYFFGVGDYFDFASAKEKKKLQDGDLHETTMQKFDMIVQSDIREFASSCSFMKGRILGLIGGNHGWKFQNGKLADEDLAERLDTDYLGWLCHFTLIIREKVQNDRGYGKNQTIHIVACHGRGGGKTAGITITQVDDLRRIFPAADLYVMGHDHQRGALPQSVLMPTYSAFKNEWSLKQKRQFLCRSGSFKRAYMEGESSYEVGRLLKPADLGALKMILSFHRDIDDNKDMVTTDIKAEI